MSTTLESIRLLVRQRADMEHSEFVSDSELDSYINNSYKELYDIIVSRFEDYYSVRYLATVGVDAQLLVPEDFYKLRGVDLNRDGGGDNWITVSKWIFGERNQANRTNNRLIYGVNDVQYRVMGDRIEFLPVSSAPGGYRIWYIPKTPTLTQGVLASAVIQSITYSAKDVYTDGNVISIQYTSGGVAGSEVVTVVGNAITVQINSGISTADQIVTAVQASVAASALVSITAGGGTTPQNATAITNLSGSVIQVDLKGVNGWDEYVIIDAAIKCLVKEESDTNVLLLQKQQMLARIEALASNRDAGDPERVTNTSFGYGDDWGGFGYGGR